MVNSILVSSGKGGVGKTTVSVNLGIALAELGKDVVIVDLDLPTPNVAMHMNIPYDSVTLNDVIRGEASIDDATYYYGFGLKVIPASYFIESLEGFNPRVFNEAMKEIGKKFDVALFDCAPGLSAEVINAFRGGEMMLVVTTPEHPSVADCKKAIQIAKDLDVDVKGVVLNRVGEALGDMTSKEVSKELYDLPVLGEVPEDARVKRAISRKSPVVISHPLSPAARSFKKLAHYLIGKEYNETFSISDRFKLLTGKY